MIRRLIINADDYGICPEVNRAIENLVESKKLQNVSVLPNSWYYEEVVGFLKNRQECSVGVHLNVVEGVPLSAKDKALVLLDGNGQFAKLSDILIRWMRSPLAVSKAVENEWRCQIERMLNDGLEISHADSHQHIHAFPPFWRILVALCRKYDIPCLRFPRERNGLKLRMLPAFALAQSAKISNVITQRSNLKLNQHFLGFKRAGAYDNDKMVEDLEHILPGVTELSVHPSICDGVPYSHLRGEAEYQALLGGSLWEMIEKSKIEIFTWAEFARLRK